MEMNAKTSRSFARVQNLGVLIIVTHVDKCYPVIVEMFTLGTNCHLGTKNYKLQCLKAKQATCPF